MSSPDDRGAEPERSRRLRQAAQTGGSLAPRGSYGMPSEALRARSRADWRASSPGTKIAIVAFSAVLLASFVVGVIAIAVGATVLFVVAAAVLLVAAPVAAVLTARNDRRRV